MSSSGLRGRLRSRILGQFRHPTGAVGALAGVVMARRDSNQRRNAWTVQLLDLQPGDHVLEIGYGPGLAVHHIAQLAPHGQVVGIDHSQVMLRQARRRNRRAVASGRVRLLCGSVADLAGWPATFHKALAVNVLGFWPDPVAVLRQVAGVLLPGARIALTTQPAAAASPTSTPTRPANAWRRRCGRRVSPTSRCTSSRWNPSMLPAPWAYGPSVVAGRWDQWLRHSDLSRLPTIAVPGSAPLHPARTSGSSLQRLTGTDGAPAAHRAARPRPCHLEARAFVHRARKTMLRLTSRRGAAWNEGVHP